MNNREKCKSLLHELEIENLSEEQINRFEKQLERIKATKEFAIELDEDLENLTVDRNKIKALLYKEMLLLAEESVKRTRMSTDLSATALAMVSLADLIIKID